MRHRQSFYGITLTEGGCEYQCDGKQTKRGYRVYCKRTDKKCYPGGERPAKKSRRKKG